MSEKRDLLRELGVRPFINAAGTYTYMTGSLMTPEVLEALASTSQHFVFLDELHDAIGKRIASMIGCEAAMVTAGAAAAVTLGTAATLTGTDLKLVDQIPDLTGLKTEVILQKSHRFPYDHSIRNCGVRLVEVETREELERAISPRTAMLFFLNYANNKGSIGDAEFVELGRKHRIPTFNDAAADVHPPGNLSRYTAMGFDLVCFSGGKAMYGPQSTGLLLGRKDLIAAARANAGPSGATIGRGFKVSKEEMLAMFVALEAFMNRDHDRYWAEWQQRAQNICDAVTEVPGTNAEIYLPEIYNRWQHIKVSWDRAKVQLTPAEAVEKLRNGEPSIVVLALDDCLDLGVITLKPGEDAIVAKRLAGVLRAASATASAEASGSGERG